MVSLTRGDRMLQFTGILGPSRWGAAVWTELGIELGLSAMKHRDTGLDVSSDRPAVRPLLPTCLAA